MFWAFILNLKQEVLIYFYGVWLCDRLTCTTSLLIRAPSCGCQSEYDKDVPTTKTVHFLCLCHLGFIATPPPLGSVFKNPRLRDILPFCQTYFCSKPVSVCLHPANTRDHAHSGVPFSTISIACNVVSCSQLAFLVKPQHKGGNGGLFWGSC